MGGGGATTMGQVEMRLRKLEVSGFRSLADVVWEPGSLNVLIGPNGGGKSNLLRALVMLREAALGKLSGFVQGEGGMEPLVWDGTAEIVRCACETVEGDPSTPSASWQYNLILARVRGESPYRIGRETLLGRSASDESPSPLKLIERNDKNTFILSTSGMWELTEWEFEQVETVLSGFNSSIGTHPLGHGFRRSLAKWLLYRTPNTEAMRLPVLVSFDRQINPNGSNLIQVLHTLYTSNRSFKRDLDAAMYAAFGDEFEELVFPPASDQRIQLRVRWRSLHREQSAADLSEGTLRFLFLLTALASAPPSSLIAIEEPELGLHPGMMAIVAEFAETTAARSQVILTTHSPALLDALGEHTPTVTVVESHEGRTELRQIADDTLRFWVDRFSLGELFRSRQLESLG